ncbi:cytochrome P450 [Artomyces pyxidatus]|uniref:Cytochrome P450 n=1 Tax=Artomyces pyxidatus TaxID=48021 RepID=A0ACB8SWY8_9AGAM|nr:cytochrome P450 [Artomyces pyxidatus]
MSTDPSSPSLLLVLGIVVLVGSIFFIRRIGRDGQLPYPPGPRGSILVGNAYQMPGTEPWKTYSDWGGKYGALTFVTIFNSPMVVINSAAAITDLLEKRSTIYGTRPQMYMLNELMGCKYSVFNVASEHPRFRAYRKMLQKELNSKAVASYKDMMQTEVHLLLRKLQSRPEKFMTLIQLNAAAIAMKFIYGYTVDYDHDSFMKTIEDVAVANRDASGLWLCDYYPILRLMPSWLPGGSFKRKGHSFKTELDKLNDIPHDWVKEQMANNRSTSCFSSRQLSARSLDKEEEDIVKFVSTGLYAGAQDTVATVITTFVLIMSLYPDVQRRAQAEVDAVVGRDRLPNVGDFVKGEMKYIEALIKETLRWAPPVPLAVSHLATADDAYGGYHIPKGTVMVPNIWGLMHDPAEFPDPFTFNPERHLLSTATSATNTQKKLPLDPYDFVFGFGRRACPGATFGRTLLFLTMTSILSTFDISKARDEDGNEIEPRIEFDSGVVSHLLPFDCQIKPRQDAIHLIDESS